MDYEKKYKDALERARELQHDNCWVTTIFPELAESEDEKIRKRILLSLEKDLIATKNSGCNIKDLEECIAWLEKQSNTNETINIDEFAQGVLRGAAINLITWIDYNTAKGNMCLSNMECKVIEDALVSGDWDKIYAYIKRKLEKQGKPNFEQSIQDGDNVVTNKDGTHFNVSQLERVAKKVTKTEETSKEFLKSAKIMDENDELANEYRLEPKFKVGGWIVSNINKDIFLIKSVNNGYCTLEDTKGRIYSPCLPPPEDDYHLWTIQDAKGGDVLATEDKNFATPFVAIYESLDDIGYEGPTFNSHCFIGFNGNFYTGEEGHAIEDIHPATKEQRDLLFQKMKEAGYEWDAEKKKLSNIDSNIDSFCKNHCKGYKETGRCFADGGCQAKKDAESTWSEEDKGNLLDVKCIIDKVWHSKDFREDTHYSTEELESLWCWLDDIWQKVEYPQNTWKPSEEQIQALEYQVNSTYKGSWQYRASKELLEQLKKL